jgi:asparagine synthase (glutamine-hydrolysing)
MCGIVSLYSSQEPISMDQLSKATEALRHRGSDTQRLWIDRHRRVGLGCTATSLVDPAGGEQPIANEDEQLHIVVDGEFPGHEEVRKELEARGHRLRSGSPGEILLHLYEEHGANCLGHVQGEFAFAIWDKQKPCLFAARDHSGTKPLCYARFDDTLYVASEPTALFAAGIPTDWGVEIADRDPNDSGSDEAVRELPPGHYLEATHSDLKIVRHATGDSPDPALVR